MTEEVKKTQDTVGKLQKTAKKLGLISRFMKLNKVEDSEEKREKDLKNAMDFVPEVRRRFLFDDAAVKRGANLREMFVQDEPPEEDFNEIVDQDDARVEVFVSQELIGTMIESVYFRFFILILIVVNSALIALQTEEQLYRAHQNLFTVFEQCVLAIFTFEIMLKWYYGFAIFWRVGWNVLDFVIIVALFIGPSMAFLSSGRILRILRVLRAFRSLRSISALAGLTLVVETILQSIPDMANIILLLCIILLMLGVSGVTLFGKDLPKHFKNLESAMFSLFTCVTQDGWVNMVKQFKDTDETTFYLGTTYLFVSIIIGAFVFANLVVAVVVTNLEMAMKDLKVETAAEQPSLSSKSHNDDQDAEQEEKIPLVSTTLAHEYFDVTMQTPLQVTDFKGMRTDIISDYFLILTALEENLAEYVNIKHDLKEMLGVVRSLNMVDDEDAYEPFDADDRTGLPKLPVEAVSVQDMTQGDIMSHLIRLEKKNVITSKNANTMDDVLRTALDGAINPDGTVSRGAPLNRRPSYRKVLCSTRRTSGPPRDDESPDTQMP